MNSSTTTTTTGKLRMSMAFAVFCTVTTTSCSASAFLSNHPKPSRFTRMPSSSSSSSLYQNSNTNTGDADTSSSSSINNRNSDNLAIPDIRVTSAPMNPNTAEYIQEMKTKQTEQALQDAIDAEDWPSAAKYRDELTLYDQIHIDDCANVLSVNTAFYQAFTDKDVEGMERVWMPSDTAAVQCIHPSLMQPSTVTASTSDDEDDNMSLVQKQPQPQQNLVGYRAVLDSWKAIFYETDNTRSSSQEHQVGMEPSNVRLSVKGTTAFLTCNEEIYVNTYVPGKGGSKVVVRNFCATNIFRKVAGIWRMVHHHASYDSNLDDISPSDNGSGQQFSIQRLIPNDIVRGNGRNARKKRGNNNNGDFEGISINGLEGLSGMGMGMGSLGKQGEVKRVFMGSLSDLLSGSLDDIIGSSDSDNDDDDDEIEIIRIRGDVDDDDDNEDDDDNNQEDDDETEDDSDSRKMSNSSLRLNLRDDNSTQSSSKRSSRSKRGSRRDTSTSNSNSATRKQKSQSHRKLNGNNKSNGSLQQQSIPTSRNGLPKDALRQNCISALRRLCNQGAISQKQKRLLLTDIITCSAKGEFSMVEVAYELLCGDDEEDDEVDFDGGVEEELQYDDEEEDMDNTTVLRKHNSVSSNSEIVLKRKSIRTDEEIQDAHDEEFADQCRVFANELVLQQQQKQ